MDFKQFVQKNVKSLGFGVAFILLAVGIFFLSSSNVSVISENISDINLSENESLNISVVVPVNESLNVSDNLSELINSTNQTQNISIN